MLNITNIRTKLQFTQYGDVKTIVYNGNKLQAMNCIKNCYGIKSFSILHEFKTDTYLPTGYYTFVN
jgi:hypothetical protein